MEKVNTNAKAFATIYKMVCTEQITYLKYYDPHRGVVLCLPIAGTDGSCLEVSCRFTTKNDGKRYYRNYIVKKDILALLPEGCDKKLISKAVVSKILGYNNFYDEVQP